MLKYKDMYALLMKNRVYVVLSGPAVIGGHRPMFQFAKYSMNIRNNKTRLVKILPTGLQLISKSILCGKQAAICCCIMSLQNHSFPFWR